MTDKTEAAPPEAAETITVLGTEQFPCVLGVFMLPAGTYTRVEFERLGLEANDELAKKAAAVVPAEPAPPAEPAAEVAPVETVADAAVPQVRKAVLRRRTLPLPVRLDDHAIAEKTREVSDAWQDVLSAREQLKAATASHRKLLKEREAKHAVLMEEIEKGAATVDIVCDDLLDWDRRMVITVRTDVDVDDPRRVIEQRSMTEQELQYPLQLGGPEAEAPVATPGETLKQIANVADGNAPPLRWHAKDGKLCAKEACKRRHTTSAELLKRAGVEPEVPPVTTFEASEAFPATFKCHPGVGSVTAEEPGVGVTVKCPECGTRWLAVREGLNGIAFHPLEGGPVAPAGEDLPPVVEACSSKAAAVREGKEPPVPCNDARCPEHGVIAPEPPKTVVTLGDFRGRHTTLGGGDGGNCYDATCERLHTSGVPPKCENPDGPPCDDYGCDAHHPRKTRDNAAEASQ